MESFRVLTVIPANTGIQWICEVHAAWFLDPHVRGDDGTLEAILCGGNTKNRTVITPSGHDYRSRHQAIESCRSDFSGANGYRPRKPYTLHVLPLSNSPVHFHYRLPRLALRCRGNKSHPVPHT